MRHKQGKHFSITLLVSFTIHLFMLTLLFTLPSTDGNEGYKKVKVKLLTNSKSSPQNKIMAEKYSSFTPSAGAQEQSPTDGNSTRSTPAEPYNTDIPMPEMPKQAALEDSNNEVPKTPEENANKMTKNDSPPTIEHVRESVEKEIVPVKKPIPEIKAQPQKNEEDDGTVIGNSRDSDSDKLASYEQMLPLWLDKFKQSPTNSKGWKIEGEGEVFIKIDRKGKVLLAKVIKSTGSLALDKALMKMIEDADPVLPVPDDYHADKKTFSYKIAFEFNEPRNEQQN